MNNIHKAINFATIAHKNQLRKTTEVPYISHIFEVALILAQNGADETTTIVGILHDTVEDTATTIEEITEQFGTEIASLVAQETENKALSWEERKEFTIQHLPQSPLSVQMVTCADKLSNIRTTASDLNRLGDQVWDRFKRGYNQQKWYYTAIVNSLVALNYYPMYQELKDYVQKVFAK